MSDGPITPSPTVAAQLHENIRAASPGKVRQL